MMTKNMRTIQSAKNSFYASSDEENRKKIIDNLYRILTVKRYEDRKDYIKKTITELELEMIQEKTKNITIKDSLVINPISIYSLPFKIDFERIYKYIDSYVTYTDEYRKDKNICIVLDKIMTQWWFTKCINGKEVGNGNESIDIVKEKKGFDVFSLTIQNNCILSGEKSLTQDFKNAGKKLDVLFEQKEYKQAIDLYIQKLREKLKML